MNVLLEEEEQSNGDLFVSLADDYSCYRVTGSGSANDDGWPAILVVLAPFG